MNTYRKITNSTTNITSTGNGWIETPSNKIEGSSFVAQVKLFCLNVSLIAAVVAIVAHLGGLI